MKKGTKKIKVTGKDNDAQAVMLNPEPTRNVASTRAPLSLDDVWGIKKNSRFPFASEEEGQKVLANQNVAELQELCLKLAEPPRTSRDAMVRVIMNKFKQEQLLAIAQQSPIKVIEETPELKKLLERAQNNLF